PSSRARHHPYIPSFPTRRSSDLARIALMPGDPSQIIDSEGNPSPLDAQLVAIMKSGLIRRMSVAQTHQACLEESIKDFGLLPTRSEEHTSELQSRFDLVCRILLE